MMDRFPVAILNQNALSALLSEPLTMEEVKRAAFMDAMRRCGSVKQAALELGITCGTAYDMLHHFTGIAWKRNSF
jgi:molybdenum-dependent DNA-binding transcriptional regulator ModE